MEAAAEAETSERAPPTTTGGEARLTVPRPVLHTGRRSRPSAKSSEQLQLEAAAAGGGAFKARPVNRRVLESVGDLGVPRVARPKPTVAKEFRLSAPTPRLHAATAAAAAAATPSATRRPATAPTPTPSTAPTAPPATQPPKALRRDEAAGGAGPAAPPAEQRPSTACARLSAPPAVATRSTTVQRAREAERAARGAAGGRTYAGAVDVGGELPATSEELELRAALREMKEIKARSEKWRRQLAAVLSDSGAKPPARSTAQLTVPREFHFASSRSAPASPPGPSPASSRSSSKAGSRHSSPGAARRLAEQVASFRRTPRRFRSLGPREKPQAPPPPHAPPKPTVPVAIQFRSDARVGRAPLPKSHAEREEELMRSLGTFKARPAPKRVLESAGDLGVPRVPRAAPTAIAEFRLSRATPRQHRAGLTSSASEGTLFTASSSSSSSARRPFKARAVPRASSRPASPKLTRSARARAAATRVPATAREKEEHFAPFKAQPMPIFSPAAAEPPLVRSATKPAPFSLESEARSARVAEERELELLRRAEEERAAREFKARKMPVGDGWAPQPSQAVTTPRPFQLGSVERAAVHTAALSEEYARREEEERRARDFRARPRPKSLGAPSFTVSKSTKPLTEIQPFGCRSDSRASERKAWETEATKRALADSAARARAQHEQQEQAAAEAAEARAKTSFKARPASVLRAKPFQVQRASHEPTKPVSPAFASKRRFGKSLGSAPERCRGGVTQKPQ